ncbi:hypothetical protein O6H91_09G037100 [Diphasiastrum complanatum]|uniref:Uncharacterized protein n=1 Tax=Diphasiastrum complanatum TaxID=34168 RepID=A0ACC2CNA5_DIPCM|nr:hypothetical protein O6H91_09G037100 [Diphasiastrum complanatum]
MGGRPSSAWIFTIFQPDLQHFSTLVLQIFTTDRRRTGAHLLPISSALLLAAYCCIFSLFPPLFWVPYCLLFAALLGALMLADQRPTAPSFAENFRLLLPLFATFHQPLLEPYQPIFLIQFFFVVYYLSWTPTLHHSWRPTSASISSHPLTLLSVFATLPRTIQTRLDA